MALVLTPTTVAAADYSIARNPAVGYEAKVYLTSKASYKLGSALLTANGDAGLGYTYVGLPQASPGPIVAVATGAGVFQTAADTITFAGLTGQFTPAGYSSMQGFDFQVGRAVELDGTFAMPTSSSVPTLTLAAGSGMLKGSQFEIWELPTLTDFTLVGCTNDKNLDIPARGTKNIPCGNNQAEWTVPGMTSIGSLEVVGLNQGFDDGLMRFAGVKCQVMIVELKEDRLVRLRAICTDWTPSCKAPYPAGDAEATVTLSGQYSRFIALPAP